MSRYGTTVAELAAAQKSGAGVPAYLRWVNRGLGRRAAAAAHLAGLSPNEVTALSGAFSCAGIAALIVAPLSPSVAVAAAAFFLIGYALDSADGQLARLDRSGSVAGEWLDHVVDAVRLPLTHFAIAVCLYRAGLPLWSVVIALLFLVLSSAWFFAQTLASKLSPDAPDDGSGHPDTPAWVSFAKLPYDVGTLYIVIALLAYPVAFVWVYAGLFAVTVPIAAVSLRRKYAVLMGERTRNTARSV